MPNLRIIAPTGHHFTTTPAAAILKYSSSHETHKIGVLYVGPGQASNESAILGNNFGSLRYTDFLHGLGRLISLHDVDKGATFLGGLDATDGDGDFAYLWEDDVMQVGQPEL